MMGCDMFQLVGHQPLTIQAWVCPRTVHVEFGVEKVSLGQVFL